MKKLILLLFFLGLVQLDAQVYNHDFETLNPSGQPSYWGISLVLEVVFDTNGVAHSDSVVIDNQLCASTTDAHNGSRALEMRNAYNYTDSVGIAGGAYLTNDPEFSSFGVYIPATSDPVELSFFYKFFPVGNDTAMASIRVYDNADNMIGETTIKITGTVNDWTQATAPVVYTMPGPAAHFTLYFLNSTPDSEPGFGTRFLVDDVSLDGSTSGLENEHEDLLNLYPNPATSSFTIHTDKKIEQLFLQDITGKITALDLPPGSQQIDCSAVAAGMYSLFIKTPGTTYIQKLMIVK